MTRRLAQRESELEMLQTANEALQAHSKVRASRESTPSNLSCRAGTVRSEFPHPRRVWHCGAKVCGFRRSPDVTAEESAAGGSRGLPPPRRPRALLPNCHIRKQQQMRIIPEDCISRNSPLSDAKHPSARVQAAVEREEAMREVAARRGRGAPSLIPFAAQLPAVWCLDPHKSSSTLFIPER